VRAVGINGCPATASIEVREEIEPPCLDAGPDVFLTCASPIARLTPTLCGGGEPYEVRWTNECGDVVGIDLALTVQRPGIYTIRAVGPNGCPASDQVRVYSRIDPATVDAGPDRSLTCEQASVDVVASVSGGTPPYLFQWHDACGVIVGRSATLTVTVPGEYTITVTTADGCISSDVVRVTSAD